MIELCRIKYGSHLFGTNSENSDEDFVSIVLPDQDDILLGNSYFSECISTGDNKSSNTSSDVDIQRHSLQKFIFMLETGQPMALEIMFAPDDAHVIDKHPIFTELQRNIDKYLSSNVTPFTEYCKQQAKKYSLKGERLTAIRDLNKYLMSISNGVSGKTKLGDLLALHPEGLNELIDKYPNLVFVEAISNNQGVTIDHLACLNKKTPVTQVIKDVLAVFQNLEKGYGKRAEQAREGAMDFKAVSHAIRVCYECIELLQDGHITLPLPQAEYIKAVKLGKILPEDASGHLDDCFEQVETAMSNTKLAAEPDREFLKQYVIDAHRDYVTGSLV